MIVSLKRARDETSNQWLAHIKLMTPTFPCLQCVQLMLEKSESTLIWHTRAAPQNSQQTKSHRFTSGNILFIYWFAIINSHITMVCFYLLFFMCPISGKKKDLAPRSGLFRFTKSLFYKILISWHLITIYIYFVFIFIHIILNVCIEICCHNSTSVFWEWVASSEIWRRILILNTQHKHVTERHTV